jgi:hypothetical protein
MFRQPVSLVTAKPLYILVIVTYLSVWTFSDVSVYHGLPLKCIMLPRVSSTDTVYWYTLCETLTSPVLTRSASPRRCRPYHQSRFAKVDSRPNRQRKEIIRHGAANHVVRSRFTSRLECICMLSAKRTHRQEQKSAPCRSFE